MMEVQSNLQKVAKSKCLPYLLQLSRFKQYIEQLSFILVGSVATGSCHKDSDIDIAVVCDEETYEDISKDTFWNRGKPSTVKVDGVQLHYYATTFNCIESKLRELDDLYWYVYANVVILRDPRRQYTRRIGKLSSQVPDVRKQRLEGKLDMLLRRSRALESYLASESEKDIMTIGRFCLELIALFLKVTALLDEVAFDPRKRLFTTALKGKLGHQVEDKVRQLLSSLEALGRIRNDADLASFAFPKKLKEIIEIVSEEANRQGFRVGLESPDLRHVEK